MIRRARGRHTVRHLGAAAIPAPDLVAVMRGGYKLVDGWVVIDGRHDEGGYEPRGDAIDLPAEPDRNVTEWLARLDDCILPDGPVGVFIGGRVHIAPATFDPPEDSPFARMCRQLDDMQPTIRQLTQKV
ncbi:hypothetical protein SEA_NUBI_76 [Gordonia phage Nubi]|uniref:Uncharacterized protein n=1 Tax=Gordonia phage Nubi TaxID=2588492 RepID=A0A514CXI0_9CAUD|nr:hypothetical protein KNU68_gp76 [Gordonia phage Nubi]QDH85209.1 hypothetical protein SEA_NUBI_76 [Gordonia phage Nubi]